MINGTTSIAFSKVQKNKPKGKAVETELASAYKSLGSEIKSAYPYQPQAKKQSYGSRGNAFGS